MIHYTEISDSFKQIWISLSNFGFVSFWKRSGFIRALRCTWPKRHWQHALCCSTINWSVLNNISLLYYWSYCKIFDCSALDSKSDFNTTWVFYSLLDCREQHKTWSANPSYSKIVSYCSILDYRSFCCSALDGFALDYTETDCYKLDGYRD